MGPVCLCCLPLSLSLSLSLTLSRKLCLSAPRDPHFSTSCVCLSILENGYFVWCTPLLSQLDGVSMEPTFQGNGEVVLVEKVSTWFDKANYHRGGYTPAPAPTQCPRKMHQVSCQSKESSLLLSGPFCVTSHPCRGHCAVCVPTHDAGPQWKVGVHLQASAGASWRPCREQPCAT